MKHLHLKASLTVLLACLIFSSMKCKKEAEILLAKFTVLYENVKALGIDYTPSSLQINDNSFSFLDEMTTESTDVYNYKFRVGAETTRVPIWERTLVWHEYSGTFPGSMLKIGKDQVNNLKITVEDRNAVLYVNGVKTVTAPFSPKGKLPEAPAVGAGITGTWYSSACKDSKYDSKGVVWKFGTDSKGSFSNKDCNGICDPIVFTFSYKYTGTTCEVVYDALQPFVKCTGYADSRPPAPKNASFTAVVNGDKLTVTSGSGTNIFTR